MTSPRRHFRQLVLASGRWQWRVGADGLVIINPDGKKSFVKYTTLTGWDQSTIERAVRKRYFAVKPSDVRDYIETKVIQ